MLVASITTAAAVAMAAGCSLGALNAEEMDIARSGGEITVVAYQALRVANSVFALDPGLASGIDPTTTREALAADIEAHARLQLGQCGMVTRSDTMVTVDFGPAPGCTLRDGTQISGSLTATVGFTEPVFVQMDLTNVVAGGRSLSGTAFLDNSDRTSFRTSFNLTANGTQVRSFLNVTSSSGQMTLDNGSANDESPDGMSDLSVNFRGVVWKDGDCYPSAGKLDMHRTGMFVTVELRATTPATGEATARGDWTSSIVELPAYGSCPRT